MNSGLARLLGRTGWRLCAFAAAIAVGLCLVQTGGADATLRTSAAVDVYSDPAGDALDATIVPDIARVTLTSKGDGTVAFDVHLASSNDLHSAPTGRGLSWIFVTIDSDRNSATGGSQEFSLGTGAEFIAAQIGPSRFTFKRWDGSVYSDFPHHETAGQFTGADLTFTLTLSDIGTNSFDFRVIGGNYDQSDEAPNTGSYAYPPTITSLVLPAPLLRPKAGLIYRIRRVTARLSNKATATPEKLTSTLRYRGTPLRPLSNSTWKIAKRYRGKTLRLSLTATYRGASATFDYAIRPR